MSGKIFTYTNILLSDDRKIVTFEYSIETDDNNFNLSETISYPESLPHGGTVDRLLRALHIALGISYYKTFVPPEISHAYTMDQDEADFWNTVFENGLAEFLYTNKLSSETLAKFKAQKGTVVPSEQDDIAWTSSTALLGIGGGKDSIVAGEILKELNIKINGFVLTTDEKMGQTQAVAEKMHIDLLPIKRKIDLQILEINKLDGAYNGHVPISLIFALTGCLLATVEGAQYVVVANEASASIPHTKWENKDINHQWSKSLEFEKMFQSYIHKNISYELHYTSVIRPLTSIAVAKIFSKYPIYFETFTSDNLIFKIKQEQTEHPRWSNDSPKTLSSFILLAPWMKDEDLMRAFGKNYLESTDLEQLLLDILGVSENPVLDCVGTPDELKLSLSILARDDRFQETALMKVAQDRKIIIKNPEEPLKSGLTLAKEHALPDNLANALLPKFEEKL